MALMETVQDNFNDNSLNAMWGTFGSGLTETNQRLEIQSQLSSTYTGIDTTSTYDLTGSYGFVELVGFEAGASSITSYEIYPVNISTSDSNNALQWQVLPPSNTVQAFKRVAGSTTSVWSGTYNSSTHKWFRVRESGGTTYWDTSADGVTWTNRHSESNPITVTALRMGILQGTWQAEGSQAKCYFDNCNIVQTATKKPNNSLLLGI